MTTTLVSQTVEWRNPKKGETAMSYQVAKLIARIAENMPEMSSDIMQGWIENPKSLQRVLRTLLVAQPKLKVEVDYTKSLDEMIQAGNYDWAHGAITSKRFPIQGQGRTNVELVLFHFNGQMTSTEVIAEMERQGYRPARIEQLLALGAAYPELQKEFHIICLGSVCQHPNGDRHVPCIDLIADKRELDLFLFDSAWTAHDHFAAVHNSYL